MALLCAENTLHQIHRGDNKRYHISETCPSATQERCRLASVSAHIQPTNPTIPLCDRLRTSPNRATQFVAIRLRSNSFLLQTRQLQTVSSCKRDRRPMLFCETGVTETRTTVNTHNSETWLPIHQTLRSRNTQIYVQRVANALKQTIPHRTKPVWLSETLITYKVVQIWPGLICM